MEREQVKEAGDDKRAEERRWSRRVYILASFRYQEAKFQTTWIDKPCSSRSKTSGQKEDREEHKQLREQNAVLQTPKRRKRRKRKSKSRFRKPLEEPSNCAYPTKTKLKTSKTRKTKLSRNRKQQKSSQTSSPLRSAHAKHFNSEIKLSQQSYSCFSNKWSAGS